MELFEVKPCSDSSRQKSRGAVRSLAMFEQLKVEITWSCPKSNQIWTAQAKNHAELSEV
ncbi:hypothetical protein [Neobacillus cucumis]|uniref:hypothetical protein n=1 Tax=Neobacillus cucumis TaxID=1740721 RepID=UPI0019649901|nr:hypothetical protein [Neobacillus cucumis]MBM7654905.1 hypothetical protein [Neobacillus cucumis]